jgi:diamine N-acetyltransferase
LSNFVIRPAACLASGQDPLDQRAVADLHAVRQIAYATWPSTFRDILSPAQINYMLDWLYALPRLSAQVLSGEHVFHLAEIDGKPVGFCAHQLHHPEPHSAKIHKLYLLPETQGIGLGRALIDEVVQAARAASHTALVLNVNKYNRAVGFYEALGFVKSAEEVIDIGNGYVMDDYVMRIALSQTA